MAALLLVLALVLVDGGLAGGVSEGGRLEGVWMAGGRLMDGASLDNGAPGVRMLTRHWLS